MDQPLYEQVAQQIEKQILAGTFLPNTRIPSLRKSSKQFNVSIATVMQAFSLLEDRGLIKARPQKGYFVQSHQPNSDAAQITPKKYDGHMHRLLNQLLHASQDKNIAPFGAAIPYSDFLPIKQLQRSVVRLMRADPEICSSYEFTPGSLELRRQIAIRMLDTGCRLQADDITITLGCQNAIMLALQATTQPGDTIAIESPAYHGVLQAIEVLHLKAIEIPCSEDTGIDLQQLEQAAQQWPIKACIVTPNNQNPTGATLSSHARQHLLNIASRHDIALIEDDVYGELGYQEQREAALKANDHEGRVLYCSSFSKSIAPGFRVGWIVGGRYQDKIEHYAYVQSLAIPTVTQTAIAHFLEHGAYDRHLRKTRQRYQANLARCQTLVLDAFPDGTRVSHPSGGCLLWVTLPDAVDAMQLYQQAMAQKIGLLPGLAFSLSNQFSHHLRLNYAVLWDQKNLQALSDLGSLVHALQNDVLTDNDIYQHSPT
ncbi:PLP-dependent aminotransferase family protein [Marinomonas pollencensis]|uniref:GntR family transcriptional regulator n=1 Tax=Marinomonas pollencensis TaxID=491954 RepID=A0A3E0DQ55_9GAMM|nr:PLP-dependent aminotransferase family protein [Marinomonas pollencensis]REG85087.1 GntR family transcriptional regulator [Marinomonas pollencensis]